MANHDLPKQPEPDPVSRAAMLREWLARRTSGDASSKRLSDDELCQLVSLLQRFCDTDLDQWELWKLGTGQDRVFISISRVPFPDTPDEMYTDMGRWADEHTVQHEDNPS